MSSPESGSDPVSMIAEDGFADVPVSELARQQGAGPIRSVDDLVEPGMFDSDEELDEFLADLYADRQAGMP